MTPVETVLAKLRNAKRAGNGWSARCPAHKDQKASLSISEGDDGRALVNCHAGCSVNAVVAAIGLTLRDLFPPSGSTDGGTRGRKPNRTAKNWPAEAAKLERVD